MRHLPRAQLIAVWIWIVLTAIVWNGIYDVLVSRGAREYLFRWALHEAGRGPAISMQQFIGVAVRDAIWIATLWAGVILLAGMATIRLVRTQPVSRHAQADS